MNDRELMLLAIGQARLAAAELEVPVGAVISRNGEVVSVGRNRRETVIEGDENSEISEKFFALARKLLESEEAEKEDI